MKRDERYRTFTYSIAACHVVGLYPTSTKTRAELDSTTVLDGNIWNKYFTSITLGRLIFDPHTLKIALCNGSVISGLWLDDTIACVILIDLIK